MVKIKAMTEDSIEYVDTGVKLGKESAKKHFTFYSFLGLLGDILLYPILIISILTAALVYFSKMENKFISVWGISLVKVLSGSMTDGGFNVGDIVVVKTTDADKIDAGTIIVFYYASTLTHSQTENLVLLQSWEENTQTGEYEAVDSGNEDTYADTEVSGPTGEEIIAMNPKMYFHRIIGVYVDSTTGMKYFKTQGDSNTSADYEYIRTDLVIGKYINTPDWVRYAFNFCSSAEGMIWIVILPLAVLILFECFSVMEQISQIFLEKKVIEGEVPYNSKESLKANIGRDMDSILKIYFYAISPNDVKADVFDFLYSYLKIGTTKERIMYNQIKSACSIYDKNPTEYWKFWRSHITSESRKIEFENLWRKWYIELS